MARVQRANGADQHAHIRTLHLAHRHRLRRAPGPKRAIPAAPGGAAGALPWRCHHHPAPAMPTSNTAPSHHHSTRPAKARRNARRAAGERTNTAVAGMGTMSGRKNRLHRTQPHHMACAPGGAWRQLYRALPVSYHVRQAAPDRGQETTMQKALHEPGPGTKPRFARVSGAAGHRRGASGQWPAQFHAGGIGRRGSERSASACAQPC